MKKLIFLVCCFLSGVAIAKPYPVPGVLAHAKQLIVVVNKSWRRSTGFMQRYERSSLKSPWKRVGKRYPAVLGENGMAWGVPYNYTFENGPSKKEGDRKSPAGAYSISEAFGYLPYRIARDFVKLPYHQFDDNTRCIPYESSPDYNEIIDNANELDITRLPSQFERIRPTLFRLGAVIDFNRWPKIIKGAGSCIFLHVTPKDVNYTAGCTATLWPYMKTLLTWLSPKDDPAIVQLPEKQYRRLQKDWQLPRLS